MGRQICTVCCGTKRLVEIRCPSDCHYLVSAQHHPPAVVQRQQEFDRALLLPLLQGLTERQARLFLSFGTVAARHEGDALQKLHDDDIAQAAGALAATLETTARGILYEHQPASRPAARLMAELKALAEDLMKNSGGSLSRDAAIALRRLEQAAQSMTANQPDASGLQALLLRVLAPPSGTRRDGDPPDGPSLIVTPEV